MPARPLFGRVVATDGPVAAHEYPAGIEAAAIPGRTIGAYLRELRVALAGGFADESHFPTTFRRALHLTPGQHRSAARGR